jgi:hypothetical protein
LFLVIGGLSRRRLIFLLRHTQELGIVHQLLKVVLSRGSGQVPIDVELCLLLRLLDEGLAVDLFDIFSSKRSVYRLLSEDSLGDTSFPIFAG